VVAWIFPVECFLELKLAMEKAFEKACLSCGELSSLRPNFSLKYYGVGNIVGEYDLGQRVVGKTCLDGHPNIFWIPIRLVQSLAHQ